MRTRLLLVTLLLSFSTLAIHSQTSASSPATLQLASPGQISVKAVEPGLVSSYGKLPLSFEANQGQSDPQVKFLSRGNGYSLFLTDSAAVLRLTKGDASSPQADPRAFLAKPSPALMKPGKTDVVRMELAGASPGLQVTGAEQLPGVANYLIGNDPAKWHSHVPTYAKVKYSGVYPGIDLIYYGNQRQLEYDFVLAPGADPKPVRLHFAGAEKLTLNEAGDLTVSARNGQIIFHKPAIYQMKDGRREPVDGRFSLLAKNTVGFDLGAYDHARALVIDPTFTLAYATYLGGSGGALINYGIAADQLGNAYITGETYSSDFPTTPGAFQTVDPSPGFGPAFVTKLNAAGSALIYSTYLGGNDYDQSMGIAVDNEGSAYVTGMTNSTDFPVTNGAFQTALHGYQNIFVTKLSRDGSGLVYSTYLGGRNSELIPDTVGAIAVDMSGHAFVTGGTSDEDFPVTPGAFQRENHHGFLSSNAFVTELASDGSSLIYSTYLGGSIDDSAVGIAVDAVDEAYVTGAASSRDFPVTAGAFQTVNKNLDDETNAFITKLSSNGSSLIYSTYLGGSVADGAGAIAVDGAGNAYLAGGTSSPDFPVTDGAYEVMIPSGNDGSGFVTKLNPTGSALVYSTYFGAAPHFTETAIAVDLSGHAYVSGSPWLRVLNTAGSGLSYSSPVTGFVLVSMTVDGSSNAYLAGFVGLFPPVPVTSGAFQPTDNANANNTGYVAKLALNGATTTSLTSNTNPEASGENVTFTAHVAPVTGSGVPSGIVSFTYHDMEPQHVALDASGNASYTTSSLPVGANPITAVYLATEEYPASSASLTQIITGQVAAPHFTNLEGTFGGPLLAEIEPLIPGPTIYYTTDGTMPGLSSTKYTAPVPITQPTTMIKAIAVENGDTQSTVATVTYNIVPAAIATTTSLQSSLSPSVEGQPVTFTATVTAASGPTPTGSVTFKHGSTILGSVPLTGGVATFTTSDLAPNFYNFEAVYTGSATDPNSHSGTLAQQVTAP